MELDITRKDRQQDGANKWRRASGIGTLNWPPRFGKTYGTIEFIINPFLANKPTNRIIIVVPSEITSKQWEDNLKSYAESTERIQFCTASYLSANPSNGECDLLIVDEIQKFLTEDRKAMIDGTRIKHHYRLGLTGTYPYGTGWIEELYPIVDKIEEEEAISNGWTTPFVEYNYLLELPNGDKARYERFSKPITESLILFKPILPMFTREEGKRIFDTELNLLQACAHGFKTTSLSGRDKWITYDQLCNTLAYMLGWTKEIDLSIPVNEELHKLWSPIAIHTRAKTFMDFIRKRNEILIDNNAKLDIVGNILEQNMVPTIIFNESTEFANRLTEYLNARFGERYKVACYHSKILSKNMIDPTTGDYFKFQTGDKKGMPKMLGKDSIKRIVIEGFKNGYYNGLVTANALNEGLDVPKIEQVICTGGTTDPLTYQQRTARGKTVDFYNPDKITKIFNIVFDNFSNSEGELIKSRDKTKLILRQQLSGSSVKWVNSLSEINFTSLD